MCLGGVLGVFGYGEKNIDIYFTSQRLDYVDPRIVAEVDRHIVPVFSAEHSLTTVPGEFALDVREIAEYYNIVQLPLV